MFLVLISIFTSEAFQIRIQKTEKTLLQPQSFEVVFSRRSFVMHLPRSMFQTAFVGFRFHDSAGLISISIQLGFLNHFARLFGDRVL